MRSTVPFSGMIYKRCVHCT